jgi:hypothetical protein
VEWRPARMEARRECSLTEFVTGDLGLYECWYRRRSRGVRV